MLVRTPEKERGLEEISHGARPPARMLAARVPSVKQAARRARAFRVDKPIPPFYTHPILEKSSVQYRMLERTAIHDRSESRISPRTACRSRAPSLWPPVSRTPLGARRPVALAVEKDGDAMSSSTGSSRPAFPRSAVDASSRSTGHGRRRRSRRASSRARPAGGTSTSWARTTSRPTCTTHGQLDLNALLETETTLGLPMKPLCREDCRGLCPVCGGNRNITACACEERPPRPALGAAQEAGRPPLALDESAGHHAPERPRH